MPESSEKCRKIELPDYCCPVGSKSRGGDKDCDHDFPPESKKEFDESVEWTCSKCGMTQSFEVYD